MAVYKKGKRWVADFRIGGRSGRRIRRSAPTRKLAESIEREFKTRELRDDLGIVELPKITLKEFVLKYLDLHDSGNRATTQELNRYILNLFLAHIGNIQLRNIRAEDIESYRLYRTKRVKPVTVNIDLRIIRSLFNRAIDWRYLTSTPMKSIKALKVDEKEYRFLTPEEGKALMDTAHGQMRSFIVTGLNTGMRKGELFRLEWQDVDLERREVRVRMTKARKFRIIPMNDLLTHSLQHHPHHSSLNYIFHNKGGSHWKDIRGGFNSTLKRAGLPECVKYFETPTPKN